MLNPSYSLQDGLFYGACITIYLLAMMITLNPRIWGYSDYPERVKQQVEPPSDNEKKKGSIVAIPYFVFTMFYPVYSVLKLRTMMGGIISFSDGFVHLLILTAFATLGDMVLLDWLIISKITPGFVIIEGSEADDYKDFSHHFVGHAYSSVILILLCGLVAYMVSRA